MAYASGRCSTRGVAQRELRSAVGALRGSMYCASVSHVAANRLDRCMSFAVKIPLSDTPLLVLGEGKLAQ
jgi:hypothetical protein